MRLVVKVVFWVVVLIKVGCLIGIFNKFVWYCIKKLFCEILLLIFKWFIGILLFLFIVFIIFFIWKVIDFKIVLIIFFCCIFLVIFKIVLWVFIF